jgi:hypothetical protein
MQPAESHHIPQGDQGESPPVKLLNDSVLTVMLVVGRDTLQVGLGRRFGRDS